MINSMLIKSTILIHVVFQTLCIIALLFAFTLSEQDILTQLTITKIELTSIISLVCFGWQFIIAILFFSIPPFAYKNQLLDLVILFAYPATLLFTYTQEGVDFLLNISDYSGYLLLSTLSLIYYFVSVLDLTEPYPTSRSKT